MAVTDAPKILTSRFGDPDSHTLERYEATGGYQGLRAALAKTPAEVTEEVKSASLLGRGGAGGLCSGHGAWLRRGCRPDRYSGDSRA